MVVRLKKLLVWVFWNPKSLLMRDENGKVIPDRKRKRHSKQVQDKINLGEIKLGDKPRCLRRQVKGRVSVVKLDAK